MVIIKMLSQSPSWGVDIQVLHNLLVSLSSYLTTAIALLVVTLFFYFQSDYYRTPINDVPFYGTSKPIPPSPAARMQWITDSTQLLIDGYMKVWSLEQIHPFGHLETLRI